MRAQKAWAGGVVALLFVAGCSAVLGIGDIPTQDDGSEGGAPLIDAGGSDGANGQVDGNAPPGRDGAASDGSGGDAGETDAAPSDDAPNDVTETDATPPGDSGTDAKEPTDSGPPPPIDGGHCGGVCVAVAPTGWTGPFELAVTSSPLASSSCPSGTTDVFAGNTGLNAPNANCSSCSCGTPTGLSCEVDVVAATNATCSQASGSGQSTTALLTKTCAALPSTADSFTSFGVDYAGDPIPQPTATWSATPSPQTGTAPPYTWSNAGLGCGATAPTTAGCSTGGVCVPAPSSPFQSNLCVSQTGDVACAAGSAFSQKTLYYDGVPTDTRGCTACGCEQKPSATCTATASLFQDVACVTSVGSTNAFNAPECLSTSGGMAGLSSFFQSWQLTDVVFAGTPQSTPTGGTAEGSATATGAVTVCCEM